MLDINHLNIQFHDTEPVTNAVTDFSLQMKPGEIVGIVGESGSGKTMTALSMMGLLNRYAKTSGEIWFQGKNLLELNNQELQRIRGKDIGMIFQEPMTSLNPVLRIGEQVEEGLRLHQELTKEEYRSQALKMLQAAELPNPEEVYGKYPHELSGGMRQRVMIASALICDPALLIADEPTTALDVTIQRQIIQLLKWINQKKGTAIMFISHNLGVVQELCDRVVVMYKGKIVEQGYIDDVFYHPQDDYTKRLLDAIPTRTHSLRRRKQPADI
ncbi:MAG: ABC transporter ATP-binding protein [Lachnospiraceae bacterium]|nr:ABC transporter ATP-binding protein [Lachnospiraceae bacterium]